MSHTDSLARELPWQPRIGLRHARHRRSKLQNERRRLYDACTGVRPSDDLRGIESPRVLQTHLWKLCAFLETRLHKPIRVVEGRNVREVRVFDSLVYRIDQRARTIEHGYLGADDCFRAQLGIVQLWRPLCKPFWLTYAIQRLDLLGTQDHPDLFVNHDTHPVIEDWLARAAFKLLLGDPRFLRLRMRDLPLALGLDTTLMSLALMSRQNPRMPGVTSERFTRVWQNEDAYRRVGAVAPQLLPLFDARLQAHRLGDGESPLAALKTSMLESGLAPSTWRYVLRYGARTLRYVWEHCTNATPWNTATHYLGLLQDAGLPPPAPPSVLRAWISMFGGHQQDITSLPGRRCTVPEAILRAGLIEADRLRSTRNLDRFPDQFLDVATWAFDARPKLDRNRRHGGWPLMQRLARSWHEEQMAQEQASGKRWTPWFRGCRWRQLEVRAMDSAIELTNQGEIMRNCVAIYVEDCIADRLRLYTVYAPSRRRPIAHVSVCFNLGIWRWQPWQAKGFANAPANADCHALMHWLAQRFNAEEAYGLNRPLLRERDRLEARPNSPPHQFQRS